MLDCEALLARYAYAMDEAGECECECLWLRLSNSSTCGGGVSMRSISSSSSLRVGETSATLLAASPPSGSWIASRRAFLSLRGVTARLPSSVLWSPPSVDVRDIETLEADGSGGAAAGAERTNGSSSSSFGSTSHHNPGPPERFVSIDGLPPVPAAVVSERKIDPTDPLRLLPAVVVAREMDDAGVCDERLSASVSPPPPRERVGTDETDAPRPLARSRSRWSLRGDGGAEVLVVGEGGGTEDLLSSDERGRRQRERAGEVEPERAMGAGRSSMGVTGVKE